MAKLVILKQVVKCGCNVTESGANLACACQLIDDAMPSILP